MEFAQHKEYSPGDELRHVDWKAYGKLDRYYVKQFEQESQLTVYLVLDASASMARSAAAACRSSSTPASCSPRSGYLAISQQDKVRPPSTCGDRAIETACRPRAHHAPPRSARGARHGDRRRAAQGRRGPRRRAAPDRRADRAAARALIVLASDLFDEAPARPCRCSRSSARSATTSRWSTCSIRTSARSRTSGLTQFESLETAHKMLVNPAAIRREYLERMDAFLARCRGGRSAAAGVDYHLVSTDRPLEDTLLDLIAARSRLGPGARRAG